MYRRSLGPGQELRRGESRAGTAERCENQEHRAQARPRGPQRSRLRGGGGRLEKGTRAEQTAYHTCPQMSTNTNTKLARTQKSLEVTESTVCVSIQPKVQQPLRRVF